MCCERLATTAAAAATRLGRLLLAVLDGHEVDFAFLDVDAGEPYVQRIGQPVCRPERSPVSTVPVGSLW